LLASLEANATSKPRKGKLQYVTEPDLATHTALRLSRKEVLARNLRYDVRKFAKFMRGDPVLEAWVDPRIFQIADEISATLRKEPAPAPSPEPSESSQQRIINNLTRALLGLAVRHYKLHVGTGVMPPKLTALTPASEEMSADLSDLGVKLGSDTIAKHLKAASRRVVEDDEDALSAIQAFYKAQRLT
jgi:hypothetical protein